MIKTSRLTKMSFLTRVYHLNEFEVPGNGAKMLPVEMEGLVTGNPWGVHSVNWIHSMIFHRILKKIPILMKYWKIPPKIVLLNPPPNIPFQLRKPLVSPDIVGIHINPLIFNNTFILYYQVVTNRIPNSY